MPPTPQPKSQPRPRKRKNADSQAEFWKVCTSTLKENQQPITEYDAFGINISKKLSKMEPTQAIYAESLISSIIRKGLLNKLKDETDICENGCNLQRSITPYSQYSSTASSSSFQPLSSLQPMDDQSTVLRTFYESAGYNNN